MTWSGVFHREFLISRNFNHLYTSNQLYCFRSLEEDRYMQPEIQEVIRLVRENRVWEIVEPHLESMAELEEDHPNALRQCMGSPTGVRVRRVFDQAL